jgi:hypothetical protein
MEMDYSDRAVLDFSCEASSQSHKAIQRVEYYDWSLAMVNQWWPSMK